MPRQKKDRKCGIEINHHVFKPRAIPMDDLEQVDMDLDELEAMYLCDYLNNDQTQTAELMGISRGTVQRLLYSARYKMIDFIINKKFLNIISSDHIVPPDCMETWKEHGHRRRRCGRGFGPPPCHPEHERGRGRGRGRGPGRRPEADNPPEDDF